MWFISSWYLTCLWIQAKAFIVLVLTWYSCFLHTSDSIRELNLNSPPKFVSLCQREPYTVKDVMGSCQIPQTAGPQNSSWNWSPSGHVCCPGWCSCLYVHPVARLSVYPRQIDRQTHTYTHYQKSHKTYVQIANSPSSSPSSQDWDSLVKTHVPTRSRFRSTCILLDHFDICTASQPV